MFWESYPLVALSHSRSAAAGPGQDAPRTHLGLWLFSLRRVCSPCLLWAHTLQGFLGALLWLLS